LFKFRILPDLIDSKQEASGKTRINIWSAACSTGQEVYSIAISILQVIQDLKNFEIDILGTDISEQALAQASYGKYNTFEIERGLPKTILNKYFNPLPDGWRIKDEVRSMVRFQKLNLMHDFSRLGKFDVIFCRNVAIYFSHQDKVKLFSRLARALQPQGYLLLGGSESLSRDIAPQLESKRYLRATYYHLRQEQQAKAQSAQTQPTKQQQANTQGGQVWSQHKPKQPALQKQSTQDRPAPEKRAGPTPQKQAPEPEPAPAPRSRQQAQAKNPAGEKRLLDRFSKSGSSSGTKPGLGDKQKGSSSKTLLQRLAENKKDRKK
ncbi:MAG: CheR family methyltransferase, partial [Desulfohalobiaceae bacterium]